MRHTVWMHQQGLAVVLMDFREHGCSDGRGRGARRQHYHLHP